MTFENRGHVETTGKFGVAVERDEMGLRAKQLNSFWIYVDEEDSGYTKHAINDGYWEAWITLWMDRNVNSGWSVLDIGANHGYYSLFLASKGCYVTAAEPQPRLVELLIKSDKVNGFGISILDSAICDKLHETIEMMVPIHHGMNATISNQFSYAPDGYENITVKTTTLDNLDGVYGGYDFIKVDAEGAEDLIWAGSKKYRRNNPRTLWLMEWRWDRYKRPEEFAKEIFDSMDVWYVDFDGLEYRLEEPEQLASKKNEDWMLVLRSKSS